MQQAIYNSTHIQTNPASTPHSPAVHTGGALRWVARNWDFMGVLVLMGSSAAYGVFALAHAGL